MSSPFTIDRGGCMYLYVERVQINKSEKSVKLTHSLARQSVV